MAIINSQNNFRVQQWAKLKDKTHRNKQKLFMVEGYHLVAEAHKAGNLKEIITTEKSITTEDNASFDVTTYQVTYDVMEKLTSLATPTKIMGICTMMNEASYHNNYEKAPHSNAPLEEPSHGSNMPGTPYGNSILLVDQIHHPGNLGTIIRSAVAFGVDTIVISNSVDIYNQKVIQATQGMIFHINILKRPLGEFIMALKSQGYQIIGTDVKECTSLAAVKAKAKRAVLVGNEGDGLSRELLDICDVRVNIEMNEKCESLNVGVATSIVLYCLSKSPTLSK